MKIEFLREFWMLGKYLNFSKAAEELFISQSTLSRHIAAMESELGQRLIKRDTHNVELTPAGIITLDTCRYITERYQHYLEQIELLEKGAFGYFCLAECYYAVDKYLTTSLRHFKDTFPSVTINLLAYQPHEVILLPEYDINYQEYIKSVFRCNGIYPKIHLITERVDSLNANILKEHAIAVQPEHMMDLPHRGIVFVPARNLEIYSTITYIRRKDSQNPTVSLYLKNLTAI